jgi:phage terminase large subunit GpA-like protein
MTTATLTELQTERARLKALDARRELDEATAETRRADDLLRAALAVRALLADVLRTVPARLAQAIEGEQDETRVHYLLSDAVHTMLDDIGRRAEAASSALPEFGARFRRGARPRSLQTVSQWADKQRWLIAGTNAPGKWRTDLTPYLRDIQDDLSEHSPVRTVVFIKSSGVGGTEAMFNWLGYCMHHLGNRDMLVVVPSLELRDRSFNPRLSKMISENPPLADLVSRASRSSANRADILEYGANARIIKAGANSADSLRSDHLPYVICDEVDAYKWDVGGEGDPMTLVGNRQRTFSRAKTFLVSTPTNADESRIDQAYQRSDRRRYHVPCPHCGDFHHLKFSNLKYRTEVAESPTPGAAEAKVVVDAWYVCESCGAEILEGEKPTLLARGRWIAERPRVKLVRGYHINSLYAPIGLGLGWRQIAQKWVDVQGDTAALKAFVNTYLGEVWREEGDGADAASVLARVEPYTIETLRAARKVRRLTAGVDVQKDRLECSLAAWGVGEEGWLLDHQIFPGDTATPGPWDDLDEYLRDARVAMVCVDAGYNTSMAMAFCAGKRWALPTKGVTGMGRPLIEDERRRKMRLRVRRKKGQPIEPLGVDQAKSLIYARLKLPTPGPGYLHFPADPAFDDEYFAQLAAEQLVKRIRGSRVFSEWKQIRPRNEALDCLILALAACRLAGPLATGYRTPPDSATSGRADGKAQDADLPLPSDRSHVVEAAEASDSTTAADTAAQVFAAMMAARAAKSRVRR